MVVNSKKGTRSRFEVKKVKNRVVEEATDRRLTRLFTQKSPKMQKNPHSPDSDSTVRW